MSLKSVFPFLAILFLSISASSQIQAVERFLKENDDLQKYFIYQSTLRMLNNDGDENFNKLIKGIRKINVYVAEESTESAGVSKASYQRMISDLTNEKFETLVSAKTDGTLVNLMSRESGSDAYYVLAVSEGNNFGLMEMDGKLDLRYLEALDKLDFTKLRKIVGQEEKAKDPDASH